MEERRRGRASGEAAIVGKENGNLGAPQRREGMWGRISFLNCCRLIVCVCLREVVECDLVVLDF